METTKYRFDEVTINHDKKRKPLSAQQRAGMQGEYRYYGAQSIIDHVNDYLFDGEFLLIAEDGENLKSGKQDISQIVNGQFWLNNHAHIVQTNELCNLRYLGYWLNAADISGYITGSAQPKLSQSNMNAIEIDLPAREIQDKIVSILHSFDKKIEANNQINRNLSEQARVVYNEKFGSLEKTKVLEDYPVKIYSGGTPSTSKKEYWEDGNIHWLSSGETANEFVITTEKTITQLGIDNSSTKWASKYDVVTASAGQGHTRGQTTMILLDTCINQSVIVTHAEKDYMPFIFYNVSGRYEELRVLSDGTSTRGSLTTKIMAKLEMPDVSEEEMKAFSDYAWPIISQIEVNLKENERLTELRDSLLPKLMSGELDVSDLDL